MARLILVFSVVLLFGCGKNDNFNQVGAYPNGPLTYAPPPTNYPGGGYPNGYNGQYPYGGNFQPQLPSGYPQQYYPYVPLDNYFRQNPQSQQYWGQLWGGWQNYCQIRQCSQYNFRVFWQEYCPTAFGGQSPPWYNYFNQHFYGWYGSGVQLPSSANPNSFWEHYVGYPYPEAIY